MQANRGDVACLHGMKVVHAELDDEVARNYWFRGGGGGTQHISYSAFEKSPMMVLSTDPGRPIENTCVFFGKE